MRRFPHRAGFAAIRSHWQYARWLAGLLLMLALPPAAAFDRLTILVSQDSAPAQEFARSLKAELAARRGGELAVTVTATLPVFGREAKTTQLVVAVGVQAFQQAAGKLEAPHRLLGVLIPQASYEQVRASAPGALPLSAITLDQPLSRQFALVRQLLPRARTLGVLLGPSNAALQAPLAQLAERHGYKLMVRRVDEQAALLPALQQTLEASDALLALPDPLVFSRNTAQTVLLTSYRHQTPVIGYSRAYVTAGALAAVFSTPEQIAQQAADLILQFAGRAGALPPARPPAHFSVATNPQVARSLGLGIADPATLTQQLQRQEQEPQP